MTPLLSRYLIFSAMLFCIGFAGVVSRRSAIIVLIGVEFMLNAANLNFAAFWRFQAHPEPLHGVIFVLFSIAIAAAEAAVGLALIIAVYRNRRTTQVDAVERLRG